MSSRGHLDYRDMGRPVNDQVSDESGAEEPIWASIIYSEIIHRREIVRGMG